MPQILVAMQPTRGLDVGAIEGVQELLINRRDEGCAILLVSEELDELMRLSDRIAVMYEGEIVGVMKGEEADIQTLGLMMTGSLRLDGQETCPKIPYLRKKSNLKKNLTRLWQPQMNPKQMMPSKL